MGMSTVIDGSAGITTNAGGSVNPSTNVDGINYSCRAWVNFDGTRDTTGAVSTANTNRLIRASGNVTSVLRNAAGDYTITFTTAMTDVNYSVSAITGATAASGFIRTPVTNGYTVNSVRIENLNTSFALIDSAVINASIFR